MSAHIYHILVLQRVMFATSHVQATGSFGVNQQSADAQVARSINGSGFAADSSAVVLDNCAKRTDTASLSTISV